MHKDKNKFLTAIANSVDKPLNTQTPESNQIHSQIIH